MENNKNKILVISHNPFSTYQSMGKTLKSLFAAFEKNELCQIYIYPAVPDVDICQSFYRITDKDVLKFWYRFRVNGKEVGPDISTHSIYENIADEKIYNNPKNKSESRKLIRDMMWKTAPWYNRRLKQWLDREAPTCIFLAPGYAKFIYDIALKISKDYSIPIITYVCDDYYFAARPRNWVGDMQHRLLRKKIEEIMNRSCLIVGISQEIIDRYSEYFSVETALIMTGSNIGVIKKLPKKKIIKNFSYFGNVGLKRETSLADIGRALDEINRERKTEYHLHIYTGTQSEAVETALRDIKSVRMCGFLTGEAFVHAFVNADCLVHVESFDVQMTDLVSGSISTKIADSLASGIPMLAYAPAGIASVEHLRRNNCAFIADQCTSLKEIICQMLDDGEKCNLISQNAVYTADRYHISNKNSAYLKSLIEKITGE